MRVLTTSMENALKREMGLSSYVVRIEGAKKSDASLKDFYFSDNFDEVDNSVVSGVLVDCDSIKQVINFYTGSFSFGGTSIEVMHLQDTMQDVIRDYNFKNRECEVFFWSESQDKDTSTLQRLSIGIIDSVVSGSDTLTFSLVNDTRKLNKTFPAVITGAGEADGGIIPYVYGDREFDYGRYKKEPANTMTKCTYAGIYNNKKRYIIAGNGSDVGSGVFWYYDKEINKYVEVLSATLGVDSNGYKYVEIDVSPDVYEYVIGDYATESASSGSSEWEDIEDLVDGDALTNATNDFDGDLGSATLNVFINNTNENVLTEKKVFYKYNFQNIDGTSALSLNGLGTSISLPTTGGTITETSANITTIPDSFFFNVADIPGGSDIGTADLYYVYLRLKYKLSTTKDLDLFCTCSSSVENHDEIIEDICGIAGISYQANSSVPGQTLSFTLNEERTYLEWIKEIARQGASIAYVDNATNKLTLDKIDITATADKELQVADININSISPNESLFSNLINSMEISYNYDIVEKRNKASVSASNTLSTNIYGELKATLNANMYVNTPTNLLSYYVQSSSPTFFSEPRQIVSFYTNGLRGIDPRTASGDFEPLFGLELGDHFSVNKEMDAYKKVAGYSWEGQVYKIIGIAIEPERMWLQGIYIRTI